MRKASQGCIVASAIWLLDGVLLWCESCVLDTKVISVCHPRTTMTHSGTTTGLLALLCRLVDTRRSCTAAKKSKKLKAALG